MADKHEARAEGTEKLPICFVISPIGTEQSETRKRSNQVLKHIIAPAARECGYQVIRADHIAATGIITSQVVQHIMDSPLVIADLTDSNANVFYELAIRHMLRKPYIQMIHKTQPPPFDVASVRTLLFNHQDLDEAEAAREDLIKQIKAVQGQKEVESPISVAVDLEKLTKSDKPQERQIAELFNALSNLQATVNNLALAITEFSLPAPQSDLHFVRQALMGDRVDRVRLWNATQSSLSKPIVSKPNVPLKGMGSEQPKKGGESDHS